MKLLHLHIRPMLTLNRRALLALGLWWTAPFTRLTSHTPEQERFTPPPGAETAEITRAIDKAQAAMESGVTASQILSDTTYMSLHEWPRFRRLIREFARASQSSMVAPMEPGIPLVVHVRVKDDAGRPMANALVYAYQTSGKGWYSDKAPHISGMEGDHRYARLFTYVRTDDDGSFELRTIRPAGYPGSDLPAHIHVQINPGSRERSRTTEIQFDDDPRLTPEKRAESERERFVIASVRHDAAGNQTIEVELEVPAR